MATLKTEELRR